MSYWSKSFASGSAPSSPHTDKKFKLFTFNLAAQKLKSKTHASRGDPLRKDSDETGQEGLHRPQLRCVVVAVPFKYLGLVEEMEESETERVSKKTSLRGDSSLNTETLRQICASSF